jgi:hypothetical protein
VPSPGSFSVCLVFTSPTSEANLNENIMDIMAVGMFILVSLCDVAGRKGYRKVADARLRCHDYMMKEETGERNRCYDRTERFVNTSGSVSEEIFRRVPKRVFLTEKLQSFL